MAHCGVHTARLPVRTLLAVALLASMSCGGCVLCGANVEPNVPHTTAQAVIELQGLERLAPAGQSRSYSVGYAGTHLSGGDGSGGGSFQTTLMYEVRDGTVNPAPVLRRSALQVGRWEMRVTESGWSATCQGDLPLNAAATFTFRHGQPGCTVH